MTRPEIPVVWGPDTRPPEPGGDIRVAVRARDIEGAFLDGSPGARR